MERAYGGPVLSASEKEQVPALFYLSLCFRGVLRVFLFGVFVSKSDSV
jgi:hypothetical protein